MAAVKLDNARITRLTDQTEDAYSWDNYGATGWRSCVRMLVGRGYDDREIEAILRSKWTRWAADMSEKRYGHNNGRDLARFLDTARCCTPADLRELVTGTFGG